QLLQSVGAARVAGVHRVQVARNGLRGGGQHAGLGQVEQAGVVVGRLFADFRDAHPVVGQRVFGVVLRRLRQRGDGGSVVLVVQFREAFGLGQDSAKLGLLGRRLVGQ